MRVTTIADDQLLDGHERKVIGPPEGHPIDGDIRPVEAAIAPITLNGRDDFVARFRIVLDPGDLDRLTAGDPIWLSFYGIIPPFDIALEEPAPSPEDRP